MNVYFTDTYLRWAREAMMKYSEIYVLGWRLVKVCSVSLLQALQIFRQSKTGLKNNEENCLFHVRCHSLSGRAHCCRRVPGTWNEVGWKGVWREDQCGHTNLHPRAVTLGCCSEPSAFAAKIFQEPWARFLERGEVCRLFYTGEDEVQGWLNHLLQLFEGQLQRCQCQTLRNATW